MSTATLDARLKELGFGNCRFGRSFEHKTYLPSVVRFAERGGGRLQSFIEACVYYMASGADRDSSDFWQHTRDFALYFREWGVNKVVFVDGYDFVDRQGRSLISRCREGVNAHTKKRDWHLSFSEFCPYGEGYGVLVWRDEIAETGRLNGYRVFDVPERPLELPTKKPSEKELKDGVVYLGNHPVVSHFMSPKVAEVYSDYLAKKGCKWGICYLVSRESLDIIPIPDCTFLCLPVGAGYINEFLANRAFCEEGRARGVVHVSETPVVSEHAQEQVLDVAQNSSNV